MKFTLVKILTNTQGHDGSTLAVYEDEDAKVAENRAIVAYHQILSVYHNADDVLYAVVSILDEYGRTLGGDNGYREIVDHRPPQPEPEA